MSKQDRKERMRQEGKNCKSNFHRWKNFFLIRCIISRRQDTVLVGLVVFANMLSGNQEDSRLTMAPSNSFFCLPIIKRSRGKKHFVAYLVKCPQLTLLFPTNVVYCFQAIKFKVKLRSIPQLRGYHCHFTRHFNRTRFLENAKTKWIQRFLHREN